MSEEKRLVEATAVFLCKEHAVLLARKTKKIGKGKWNGYGGGVEDGETFLECAVRETWEESGGVVVDPDDLEKAAVVHFHNTMSDGRMFTCAVHMYMTYKWQGEACSTDEMIDPTWFKKDRIPYADMMPADRDWFPPVLQGRKIVAHAYLGPFQQHLTGATTIEEVDSFDD